MNQYNYPVYKMNTKKYKEHINQQRRMVSTLVELQYDIEVVATNLNIPWAIAISPEGKLYVTERDGTIRIVEDGSLKSEPLISLQSPFISIGEGGLMGIALDPNFIQNRYLYIMYSYKENDVLYNRVVRLLEENDKATMDKIILDKIPAGSIHNGGRIKIGPDQKLYITTGDAGFPANAQDLTSTAGKILRIELDGGIPADNPFRNSPVYSYGHRDPQGLSWNGDILYAAEHGEIAHDEVNIIQAGGNYGWPLVRGNQDTERIHTIKPLVESKSDTWAPSGIAYVSQGPWQNQLLVAALRGERLIAIPLSQNGKVAEQIESWFDDQYGRLREVLQDKDGSIYLTTSNRDGRGDPDLDDDKIIRLIPKSKNESR